MSSRNRKRFLACLVTLSITGWTIAGCKSAFVEAIVRNDTADPVSLIEVDYPSASFGRATLAPRAEFHYKFKILGSGATRVQWTDNHHHDHTVPGPTLHEGEEGTLTITLGDVTARWDAQLR